MAILLRGIVITAAACLPAAVHADHMSVWGPGWANMPNDIHNTRIDTDSDGVADYAVYSLSLMEDTTGVIEGTGGCIAVFGDTLGEQTMLPDVQLGDIVDIAVDGIRPVLRGSF